MSEIDYAAEYNNRARVPEHPGILAGWSRDAEAYRAARAGAWRTVDYGAGERQRIDFFPGEGRGAVVVFIHGGYWQGLDRSSSSHLAAGLNARGIDVAVPGYDLCPEVTIAEVLAQMRAAARELARHGRPLVVSGHSAGGHLAACLLATDWRSVDAALPADVVTAAYAISGLFDLAPLIATPLNIALRLDSATAQAISPIHWPPPQHGSLDAVVGGAESSEFLRQSRMITQAWSKAGVATRYGEIPGANHFTVVAPLTDPNSTMTARLAELALAAA